ncbi:integumentary mucin C.1-like isoform X2 [Eriocheir sinensis]|uniref:integumentary mucin C.1-like isoform X2 n=1 Tax=Eriocheir sinensis TaxID=95602 RepID=UPI0021C94FFE|nr:integumentary mucin C.1-like isoform X2 [Eriocheir sinensis]XP_050735342.1 integumentary mucin C.1-like isoform X2 [Eriocheir sinensis]
METIRIRSNQGRGGGGGGGTGRRETTPIINTTNTTTNTTTISTNIITANSLIFPFIFIALLLNTPFSPIKLVTADDTPEPTTSAPPVNESEVTTESGEILLNETEYEDFSDVTKFVDGMNKWDFMGSWAKYDLSKLAEDQRPLPLVTDGEDQGVFICQASAIPSTLLKTFPTLHNATFALTYYAKADGGKLHMTGEVVGVGEQVETLFNQSVPGDGTGHAEGTWGTDNFTLPELAAMGDFKLRVSVRHSASGVWAAAELRVEGTTGPPLPPVTTPAPPIVPPVTVTTNATHLNKTTTTTTTTTPAPPVNTTTEAPHNITTTTTTTTTSTTTTEDPEEEVNTLEGIAQAIWDAFYVFLALFCACLVALVALIVHGRCKYVGSYPLHRAASA